MINFQSITATDTFAYAQLHFDFASGIYSISGDNGASKSSVFLALCQGLYNRNPKGGKVDDVSNLITGKPYEIDISFSKDDAEYRVVNSRKTKSVKLYKDGKDISPKGIPATLKRIEEVLGADYETFVDLTYRNSNSRLNLVEESGDVARKTFLGKILRFNELDAALENMRGRLKELKADGRILEESIANLKASRTPLREVHPQKDTSEDEQKLQEVTGKLDEVASHKATVEYRISTARGTVDEKIQGIKDRCQEQIASLDEKIAESQEQEELWERVGWLEDKIASFTSDYQNLDEAQRAFEEASEEVNDATLATQTQARTVEMAKADYTKAVNQLEQLTGNRPEEVCSKCGQSLNAEDAVRLYERDVAEATEKRDEAKQFLDEASAELEDLKSNLKSLSEQLDNVFRVEVKKHEKLEDLRHERDLKKASLGSTESVADLEAKIAAIKEETEGKIAKAEQDFSDKNEEDQELLSQLVKDVESYKNMQASLNSDLTNKREYNTIQATCQRFNEEAKANNATIDKKLAAESKELKQLNKEQSAVEDWINVLGPNGYRVSKMKRFLAMLNESMAEYAQMIAGGTIRCMFFISEAGKVEFEVTDADKTVSYSLWSDGEKARVKLACLFAVLDLLEVAGESSYNLLFLDEVFASLDAAGREGLFTVLDHLKGRGKGIYTIAHSPIANAVVFDSVYRVTKSNGLAQIAGG